MGGNLRAANGDFQTRSNSREVALPRTSLGKTRTGTIAVEFNADNNTEPGGASSAIVFD